MRLSGILLGMLAQTVPVQAQEWSAGEERQLGPNYYVSLISTHGNWSVWKSENPARTDCFATLPVEGADQPFHLDFFRGLVSDAMYAIFEEDQVSIGRIDILHWKIQATQFYNEANGYKSEGERFFTDVEGSERELLSLDGQTLEAYATSYAERFAGYAAGYLEEGGRFNFTGTEQAVSAMKECRAEHYRCDATIDIGCATY